MGAFGIVAICPSTDVDDIHTLGYATERTNEAKYLAQLWSGSDNSTKKWGVTVAGDVIPGPETATDLATNTDGGFVWIRSGNGAPTGTPRFAGNGRVPLYYDRANDAVYVYNGSWVSVALS